MPGTLKVKDPADPTGMSWINIIGAGPMGPAGPTGPTGPSGPQGVSSIIVGDFGAITTPADLPPTGLLPADWDGPGNPAAAYQMLVGQSLYYDQPVDPLDGHLFQYISTAIDPTGWLDIGLIQGMPGPPGPTGLPGPPLITIGDFGVSKTPADLPVGGLIPADWDEPGNPPTAHQMLMGEALVYGPADTTDPLSCHLFEYVGVALNATGWVDVGDAGCSQEFNEVAIGTVDPYVADPLSTAELWTDTTTDPPALKARVNAAWVEVSSAGGADEVVVSATDPRLDPLSEAALWYDTSTAPPLLKVWNTDLVTAVWEVASAPAPDEVWVSPDAPVDPALELWFDTDEPAPPPAAMDAFMLKAHVQAHFVAGPYASHTWTWPLRAGTYLCSFQCSGVATTTGIRYVNLDMEIAGVWENIGQSKHWYNAINIHYQMNQGVSELTIPADGDYPCRLSVGSGLTGDVNDFGHVTLIPAEPGMVV